MRGEARLGERHVPCAEAPPLPPLSAKCPSQGTGSNKGHGGGVLEDTPLACPFSLPTHDWSGLSLHQGVSYSVDPFPEGFKMHDIHRITKATRYIEVRLYKY